MGDLRERVYYGCQSHAPNWSYWCESCQISALGRLTDEVERLQNELNAEKNKTKAPNYKYPWRMP